MNLIHQTVETSSTPWRIWERRLPSLDSVVIWNRQTKIKILLNDFFHIVCCMSTPNESEVLEHRLIKKICLSSYNLFSCVYTNFFKNYDICLKHEKDLLRNDILVYSKLYLDVKKITLLLHTMTWNHDLSRSKVPIRIAAHGIRQSMCTYRIF